MLPGAGTRSAFLWRTTVGEASMHIRHPFSRRMRWAALLACAGSLGLGSWAFRSSDAAGRVKSLAALAFVPQAVSPGLSESPLSLRFFAEAVEADAPAVIVTRPNGGAVERIVGAEPSGVRAGIEPFTKIMFGVNYFDG